MKELAGRRRMATKIKAIKNEVDRVFYALELTGA
jgi:hypothetical protein